MHHNISKSSTRSKNGVSYIISVIVILLITSALSGFVLIWGMNSINSSNISYSSSLNAEYDKFEEIPMIEDVQFISNTSVNIFLRNAGSGSLVVDKIYINSTLFNSNRITLGGQGSGNVTSTHFNDISDFFLFGESYKITVVTTRGVKVSGDFFRT
ncbi:hypothetical protein ACFL96_11455 [Thermoproteota archaeon]